MVKSDLWRIENNANPTRNDCRGDGCRYADISMVVDKITWKQMVDLHGPGHNITLDPRFIYVFYFVLSF